MGWDEAIRMLGAYQWLSQLLSELAFRCVHYRTIWVQRLKGELLGALRSTFLDY